MTLVEERENTAAPPRRWRRWLALTVVVAAAALVAVVLSAGFGRDPSVVESVLMDTPAPPLAGPDLDGEPVDLRSYRGQVVLVNFWASWCPPCVREYPILAQADRELGPLGLQVLGVDTQDTTEAAKEFLDEMGGQNFPSVQDPEGRLAVEWGTFGVPETFLVDRDGRIRAKVVGELSAAWVRETVVPLLDAP